MYEVKFEVLSTEARQNDTASIDIAYEGESAIRTASLTRIHDVDITQRASNRIDQLGRLALTGLIQVYAGPSYTPSPAEATGQLIWRI